MIHTSKSVDVFFKKKAKQVHGGSSGRHPYFLRFFSLLILFAASSLHAFAQPLFIHPDDRFVVRQVRFEGNGTFSDGRLADVIETEKSPTKFSSWFNSRISGKIGSPPVYFDYYTVSEDMNRLRHFYHDHGFFLVEVDTTVRVDVERRETELSFIINEGIRSNIDHIQVRGLEDIDSVVYREIIGGQLIEVNTQFRRDNLEREYQRILDLLYNSGYAKASVDSVNVPLFLSTSNVHVIMSFTAGERYNFGSIQIQIEEDKGYRIGPSIIYRQLEFEPGEIYSLARRTESERNLNRLGIFESAKIDIRIPASTDTVRSIPSSIVVRPRNKHEITPEIIVNDENNAFNIGLGMGYSNRNFMGGARVLSFRSRFRIQSIQELQLVRVWNENGLSDPSLIGAIEIGTELVQPYIISNKTSGRWGVSFQLEKWDVWQAAYLRNRIGLNHQFTSSTYGFVDWTLERIAVRIIGADADTILDARRSAILRYREPQFNSILTLTMHHDRTNDVFSPNSGYFYSITLEEGGILPSVFTYPGGRLPFSQYIKATLSGRWFYPLDERRNHIAAMKLQAGYGTLYASGNDTPIPIHRRYYAGGSGSVRGWKSRELGTMSVPQAGGNLLLEGTIESRNNILRELGGFPIDFTKVWGVVFLDFGNIWDRSTLFRLDGIALATGLGLRYDTFIGPLRIDFGWKLYDPKGLPGDKWLTGRPFFKDVTFHFGVGHAF